jgi:hypothetical protein
LHLGEVFRRPIGQAALRQCAEPRTDEHEDAGEQHDPADDQVRDQDRQPQRDRPTALSVRALDQERRAPVSERHRAVDVDHGCSFSRAAAAPGRARART